ncbi:MAG TPA: SigE family RNA polymerase sigma factor [Frankiaceae bacterium]|jgi:RNA polymerase sigma-70 factor (sigma-E family)|nr:SigE family RNA polymerase sigma factor [Frankiaceae bacterium]
MTEPEGFRDFVIARSPGLVRSAWLLTGDLATAEDLVQTALAKVWSRWAQVRRQDAPEAYVRRVLMSTFLTWNRRRWRAELAVGEMPEAAVSKDDFHEVELRMSVAHALRGLPRRQRAVMVLRYFDDLTEAQVAQAMSCSVGTVKSQNAKAIRQLRTHPALAALFHSSGEAARDTC